MSGPVPYITFPGNAREALSFYGQVFDCPVGLHTLAEFGRNDGPHDAIAHGYLESDLIQLFGADAVGDQPSFQAEGLLLSLLGAADSHTSRSWFAQLAEGGSVIDQLQQRPWGDTDGQVKDRFGITWLIGFSGQTAQQLNQES